jgi:hypothetical protein
MTKRERGAFLRAQNLFSEIRAMTGNFGSFPGSAT